VPYAVGGFIVHVGHGVRELLQIGCPLGKPAHPDQQQPPLAAELVALCGRLDLEGELDRLVAESPRSPKR